MFGWTGLHDAPRILRARDEAPAAAIPPADKKITTSEQTSPAHDVRLPHETVWVAVVLLAHLLLSLGFSTGPLFEGPDEIAHYKFVRYLAERHNLPGPPYENGTGGETHQAPLYYLINGLISQALPDGDFDQRVGRGNPYHGVEAGIPSNFNKNSRFHYLIEAFPYTQSETAMALHVLRLTSVLFSLGGVAASYLIFKRLWPDRPDVRLLAFGLVAFWPENLYMSGTLNNDNLVFLTGALAFLWLLRLSDDGPSWVRIVILGVVLGFGLLAKSSSAFLAIPVGAVILLDRRSWRSVPLLALVVILAGGWWYIRNQIVYGEPTGYSLFYQFIPAARIPYGTMRLQSWLNRMTNIYIGSWANFGDGAVGVSRWIYVFLDLLLGVTLAGLVVWGIQLWRRTRGVRIAPENVRRVLIVGLFTLSWFLAIGYIAYTSVLGVSGRVILPAVPGIAALMAIGIITLTPERLRMRMALSLTCFMAFVAAVCLFGYFRLSYQPAAIPSRIEAPLDYNFEGQAEIIGVEPGLIRARPGDTIHVLVYWRALKPSQTELMTFLHAGERKRVRVDSFPGNGNLMSTDWVAGQTWAESYNLDIPVNVPPQTIIALTSGLYDPGSEVTYTATDASQAEVVPVVARVAINGPEARFDPDYRFGSVIGLAAPQVTRTGDSVKVCTKWLSIAPVETDYHVFVHVVGANGDLIGQADTSPKAGAYPTSAWAPGEAIDDCVTADVPGLPDSGWRVTLGLYDVASGARLPVIDRAVQTLPNGEVVWAP